MTDHLLLWPIVVPAVAGLLVLLLGKSASPLREALTLLVTAANLGAGIYFFSLVGGVHAGKVVIDYHLPWAGFGMDFFLRLYQFSGFILLAASGFAFLVALYCWKFMRGKPHAGQFFGYMLISLAMVNGAVLADHLVVLLFFWEGLLLTLMGMIAIGRPGAFKTAMKAFIIVGVTDLCMMVGIAMTGLSAGTLQISAIHLQLTDPFNAMAMILLMIGAISKGGSMPFHSWIPDAAIDAPLPFMAFLPASLEKLLGIYFLGRISLDLYALTEHSWLSTLMMIVGAATILLAVMMALVQKDYKRLLSYHAISQVGYMILGIGTALPVGIVGGLFHMINHAMYKSCLFLTAGSVERQAGTTDLAKLGGLARKMPITFLCFFVAACSISGVPPFNGFFSKELIYDAALDRHLVYYLAAIIGSFLTAASFLKLGHAAYFGPRCEEHKNVKEAPLSMLTPMIVIAGLCVVFGLANWLPLNYLIQPILGDRLEHSYAGFPTNMLLVVMTMVALGGALLNHWIGFRVSGSGLGAVDHIHHAPILSGIYDRAEKRYFDPYDIGLDIAGALAKAGWLVDRAVDWVYEGLAVGTAMGLSAGIRLAHTGDYALYVIWSLVGAVAVIFFLAM